MNVPQIDPKKSRALVRDLIIGFLFVSMVSMFAAIGLFVVLMEIKSKYL